MKNNNILVSVFCPVFNHVDYIRDCLDGFVMQKTKFEFEVIVQDDASTDGSQEIILEYSEKYNFIIPRFHNENIFSKGVNINEYFFENAKGEYFAVCEGDDYWIDPFKLQKQVDFLENNPEIKIHSGLAKTSNNRVIGKSQKPYYSRQDFYTRNYIVTCAVLFRNEKIQTQKYKNIIFGDWLNYILLIKDSEENTVFVSDELFSFYRVHDKGVMMTLSSGFKNEINCLNQIKLIKSITKCKYNYTNKLDINEHSIKLFKYYIETFNLKLIRILWLNLILSKSAFPFKQYLSISFRTFLSRVRTKRNSKCFGAL